MKSITLSIMPSSSLQVHDDTQANCNFLLRLENLLDYVESYKVMLKLILFFVNIQTVFLYSLAPKLIVVSYSGFRYDYFTRNVTPFMNQLRNDWVKAEYMTSVFVTRSNPNHYSIATGYYAETHGVLENFVFHPEGRKINESIELYSYSEDILPIWTLNELSGENRSSGSMMWPAGSYDFNRTKATYVMEFDSEKDWASRIDTVIGWFLDEEDPINLAMLYFEEPSFHAHVYGTKDAVIDDLLNQLDDITKYLYDQLEENNLTDVNVIHLSDHGMTDVNVSQMINITNIVKNEKYEILGSPTTKFIRPSAENAKIIYHKLHEAAEETQAFEVYWKDDIPDRFHFRNNRRVTEIFVIVRPGYVFEDIADELDRWAETFNIKLSNRSAVALTGYDNTYPDMRAFFFATGPAFQQNCDLKPFDSVDLFPLFCDLLDINCDKTNGTAESFQECLREIEKESHLETILIVLFAATTVLALIITIIICHYRKRRQQQLNLDLYGKPRGDTMRP